MIFAYLMVAMWMGISDEEALLPAKKMLSPDLNAFLSNSSYIIKPLSVAFGVISCIDKCRNFSMMFHRSNECMTGSLGCVVSDHRVVCSYATLEA